MNRLSGERGSATVWVLALAGVLAVVGMAVVLVGAAVVARHRAGAAADLAALAGAGRAVLGDPDACAVAADVAAANAAELTGCTVRADAVVDGDGRVPGAAGAARRPHRDGSGPGGTGSAGGRRFPRRRRNGDALLTRRRPSRSAQRR